MNKVARVMFLLLLLATVWFENQIGAQAQADSAPNASAPNAVVDLNFSLYIPKLPLTPDGREPDYRPRRVTSNFLAERPPRPRMIKDPTSKLLLVAIKKRLGIPYRFYGADDRGYDCSGFVWRVFQDAGAKFTRTRVKELWKQLPDAKGKETGKFGTLVFFKGLKHVGIVRDDNSFYHSSRSKGVTLSTYDGYWGKRVKGFRRAPSTTTTEPINSGN
jgi:cell wall-associated NlpC family hydrolase